MAKKAAGKKASGSGKPDKEIGLKSAQWKQTDGETPYLETNLDKFYNLVREKQTLSFLDAAGEFGVDKKQIASWAKILEEHKLVSVHYPFFGSPSIIFKSQEEKKLIENEKIKKPKKGTPKLLVTLAGGMMLLLGYVMVVSNPFTIGIRSQMAGLFSMSASIFGLRYPLNIIIPLAIIIAVLWGFLALRHKKTAKKPKDTESKLSRIKKELESE